MPLILEAAENLNGGTTGYAKNGKTFRLLIELMLETGLRVSDAVKFNPAKCQKSKFLWIYSFNPRKAKKNEAPRINRRLSDRAAEESNRWLCLVFGGASLRLQSRGQR